MLCWIADTPMNNMTMVLWMMPGRPNKISHLVFMQFYFKYVVIGNGSTCSLPSLHIIAVDCV